MTRQRLPALLKQIPRRAKAQLFFMMVIGGLIGLAAAFASSRSLQLGLVLLAIVVGVYAGITVYRVRRST